MIVSLFCPGHGKVGAVARGVRGNRRGRILQPFANLQVSWVGKSSLVTLTGFEVAKQVWLKADRLAAGFYVTELVSRLVGERESLPRLYAAVAWAIDSLGESSLDMEFILRSFEKLLLEELGYGLDFSRDAVSGQAVIADQYYSMDPAVGFQQSSQGRYSGSALLGIHAESFSDGSVKRAAKRIFRQALAVLLGPKPLMSRRLLLGSRR